MTTGGDDDHDDGGGGGGDEADDDDEVGRRWPHNGDTGTLARRVAAGTARPPRPNQIRIPAGALGTEVPVVPQNDRPILRRLPLDDAYHQPHRHPNTAASLGSRYRPPLANGF